MSEAEAAFIRWFIAVFGRSPRDSDNQTTISAMRSAYIAGWEDALKLYQKVL